MNFRNFDNIRPPDLSAGRLVPVPGKDYMLPAWYVYNLPKPNVGTGPLLPFRSPAIGSAAFNYYYNPPVSGFLCEGEDT